MGKVRIKVTGDTDKLRRISAHCRSLEKGGGAVIKTALRKGIRKAAKPVMMLQRRTVKSLSGAPSEWRTFSAGQLRIGLAFGKKSAGLALRVPKKPGMRQPWHLNHGKWRHPVYGNRSVWVEQRVPPGWFDKPAQAGADQFYRGATDAIDSILTSFEID